MSTKFSALKISDSENTARQLMVEIGASYLPVIGDAGEPVGIIWHTDLLQRVQPNADKRSRKNSKSKEDTGPLSNVMRVEIQTIASSGLIRDAAILLQQKNCCCFLVMADNRLIGIVGPHDFLGVTIDLLQDREELKFDDLEDGDIGEVNEDVLSDIFVGKLETENWNQMDV